MILIKNNQRSISVDTQEIKLIAQQLLDILGYADFDLGIWFASDKTIRDYNKKYRNKDRTTDILSFPYHTELVAGKRIKPACDEDKNLGDMIIAPKYVKTYLAKDKTLNVGDVTDAMLREQIKTLLIHGICHLLGYDHKTESDYRIMRRKELALKKKLKNN